MLEYRRKDLDLSTRIALGLEMLVPAEVRGWGRASELVREYEISRSLLYQFKDRVQTALETALQPKPVGRPVEEKLVRVDRDAVRKAIAVLSLVTGSVRSIQVGLELLLGVRRSVGYISQTLQAAGEAAEAGNAELCVPPTVLAAFGPDCGMRRSPCRCAQPCSTCCGKAKNYEIGWKKRLTKPSALQPRPSEPNKKPNLQPGGDHQNDDVGP
jgi:hypothetical protein